MNVSDLFLAWELKQQALLDFVEVCPNVREQVIQCLMQLSKTEIENRFRLQDSLGPILKLLAAPKLSQP